MVKLGIMQPYFFPYIGYFALIAQTDRWVIFDTCQYKPKSWMNRNRILHPKEGWQYINVPIDGSSQNIKIKDAEVLDLVGARQKVLGQIDHYRKKAPFFESVRKIICETFDQTSSKSLVELNKNSIQLVCDYLNVPFRYQIASQESWELPDVLPPGSWAVEISSKLGASEYINPTGGVALFSHKEFEDKGISLRFLPAPPLIYDCQPYRFEPGLSIIDVMMWKEPDSIKETLLYKTAPVSSLTG